MELFPIFFFKFIDDHDVLSFLTFQLTEPGKEPVSINSFSKGLFSD